MIHAIIMDSLLLADQSLAQVSMNVTGTIRKRIQFKFLL